MKIAALGIALLVAATAASQTETKTVLFVCEHGAAKSVVAAAHFNRLAAQRGLPWRAISRGTKPDSAVPSRIIDGLRDEGIRLPSGFSPSLVTAADLQAAIWTVTFDVTLPPHEEVSRVRRWDSLPAFSDGYREASEAIRNRVLRLIEEVELGLPTRKRPGEMPSRFSLQLWSG